MTWEIFVVIIKKYIITNDINFDNILNPKIITSFVRHKLRIAVPKAISDHTNTYKNKQLTSNTIEVILKKN